MTDFDSARHDILQVLAAEEGWDMFQVLAEYHTNKSSSAALILPLAICLRLRCRS